MRFGGDVVTFVGTAEPRVDGNPLGALPLTLPGGAVVADGSLGGSQVALPDGTLVTVEGGEFVGNAYLNVTVAAAPSGLGKLAGLLGNGDGDPRRRVHPVGDFDAFYGTWGPDHQVGLTGRIFPGTRRTYQPPPGPPPTLADLDPDTVAWALDICLAAGWPDGDLLSQCTYDVAVSGDAGFSQPVPAPSPDGASSLNAPVVGAASPTRGWWRGPPVPRTRTGRWVTAGRWCAHRVAPSAWSGAPGCTPTTPRSALRRCTPG